MDVIKLNFLNFFIKSKKNKIKKPLCEINTNAFFSII